MTRYPVIGRPPSWAGATHETVTPPSPAVPTTFVAAAGAVAHSALVSTRQWNGML